METKRRNTFKPISESKGDDGQLGVPLGDNEVAVGTNVEYAGKIEAMDSYIRYAGENVQKTSKEEIREEFDKVTKKYNK